MSSTGSRRSVQLLVLIPVNLLILELCCYGALSWLKLSEPDYFSIPWSFYENRLEALDSAHIERVRNESWDARLGWDNKPGLKGELVNTAGNTFTYSMDRLGARTNSRFSDKVLVSAYGDSHTFCAEVNDDETWEVFLSEKLGINVRNFGVNAYGTGQALMKLERELKKGLVTPYVILGIHEENIGRVVNTYRPFYVPQSNRTLAFKPRFMLENGKLRIVPGKLDRLEDIDDARRALAPAGTDDYWIKRNAAKISKSFPYSLQLLDLTLTILDEKGLIKHPFKKPPKRFFQSCRPPSLWEDPSAVELMNELITRYVGLSREYDFHPILLFFPCSDHVDVPTYLAFRNYLRQHYDEETLGIVDVYDAILDTARYDVDLTKYRVRPDGGHLSAYGNRIVANYLYDRLVNQFKADEAARHPQTSSREDR